MIASLIRFSLIQRLMTLLLAMVLTVAGLWAFKSLPIDAFPDIAAPQVQVIVKAPGLSPTEVESRITFPIEVEMQGLPRQTVLRSTTKYALSIIIIYFEDGTDIYWSRQPVSERLNQAWRELPPEANYLVNNLKFHLDFLPVVKDAGNPPKGHNHPQIALPNMRTVRK